MRSRAFMLVFSAILVIAFAAVLVWRAQAWHEAGWTGLRFVGAAPANVNVPAAFNRHAGRIDVVMIGSPAERAGIRPGDRIVRIDGLPLENLKALYALAKQKRTGDFVEYRIARGTAVQNIRVQRVSPLRFPTLIGGVAIAVFVAVAYLGISLFVFWNRPRAHAAAVFFWFCVTGALWAASSAFLELEVLSCDGIYPAFGRPLVFVFYLACVVVAATMTTLLLHLALVFPKELPIVQRWPSVRGWLHALPLVPGVLTLLVIAPMMVKPQWGRLAIAIALTAAAGALLLRTWKRGAAAHPWTAMAFVTAVIVGPLTFLNVARDESRLVLTVALTTVVSLLSVVVIMLLYAALTIAALYRGYRDSSVDEKRQVRWPLWGTATAIIVSGVISILMATVEAMTHDPRLLVLSFAVSRLVYLLVPASFAFAILKYRLMDIDVVIRKTLVYSVVTAVIVGLFFLVVAGLGTYVTGLLRIENQTLTVLATLAVAALAIPVRNRVQRAVERRFFRRRYDAEEAGKLIQREVQTATELAPLLPKVAEYVQHVLQVRSVIVFIADDDGERLSAAAAVGVPEEALHNFALERAAIGKLDGVVPVAELRLSQDEWLRMRRLYAEIAVPMRLRGALRGLLITGSMLSGRYDEDDHAFLADTARQLAFAVESLTVGEEARDYERALEIQRSLLPKSLPRIEGIDVDATWRPAKVVGGDYFDVLDLGGGMFGICIGDVAGKGMPAALLMANLQAAVKACAAEAARPSDVCSKVATVVSGTLTGGRFVTFFFAILDTRTMTLRYTNAGHNPPILLRRGGHLVHLAGGGPVFARLMRGSRYETLEMPLEEGDTLVLFTDGVTEARNHGDEEFGEERLVEVVRNGRSDAALLVRDIVEGVETFAGGVAQDDLTLVVLRVARAGNVVAFPVRA